MSFHYRNWASALLAAGLLIVLAALLGTFAVSRSSDFLQRPSTFFTDESGARALLLVMKKLLPAADPWRRPLNLLPLSDEAGLPGTLIVAGAQRPIGKAEAEHLDQWLSAGGQLILATDDGWPMASAAADLDEKIDTKDERKRATYLSRHAANVRWAEPGDAASERVAGPSIPGGELSIQSRRKFASTGGNRTAAAAGERALALEIPVGKGRIIAVADPTVVSNRALREADNAVWLVTLAAGWGSGAALFDEFHHGFGKQRGLGELTWSFLKTPWGWCVLQLTAAGLLYVFGYRRRFGRISEPPAAPRASPLELVDARAGLFQSADARELAVAAIVQNLRQDWAKSAKPLDVQAAGASTAGESSAGLSSRLGDLSSRAARGEKLSDAEFVEIGRIAGRLQQGSL